MANMEVENTYFKEKNIYNFLQKQNQEAQLFFDGPRKK